jgi:hypothetical protein
MKGATSALAPVCAFSILRERITHLILLIVMFASPLFDGAVAQTSRAVSAKSLALPKHCQPGAPNAVVRNAIFTSSPTSPTSYAQLALHRFADNAAPVRDKPRRRK